MRFRDLVGVATDQFDLRVDHLVHSDEVRTHHIPVHMFEGSEVQVVAGAQLTAATVRPPGRPNVGQSGNGELILSAMALAPGARRCKPGLQRVDVLHRSRAPGDAVRLWPRQGH